MSFEAALQTDKQSETIKASMVCTYRDHPQRDRVALLGDVCFPNLTFDKQVSACAASSAVPLLTLCSNRNWTLGAY